MSAPGKAGAIQPGGSPSKQGAETRSFFDEISQERLIRLLKRQIGDPRIIRLIRKWLKVGMLEDRVMTVPRG